MVYYSCHLLYCVLPVRWLFQDHGQCSSGIPKSFANDESSKFLYYRQRMTSSSLAEIKVSRSGGQGELDRRSDMAAAIHTRGSPAIKTKKQELREESLLLLHTLCTSHLRTSLHLASYPSSMHHIISPSNADVQMQRNSSPHLMQMLMPIIMLACSNARKEEKTKSNKLVRTSSSCRVCYRVVQLWRKGIRCGVNFVCCLCCAGKESKC